ncbi:MAG TPA: hypothetical protein VJQ56_11685 [Blastocatellia bacterium]|nr:hypothetical protein [Blastocatellia bacterium]
MILKLNLEKRSARLGVLLAGLTICALAVGWAASQFVVATFADSRLNIGREYLAAASDYFPNSARLHARAAAAEAASSSGNLKAAEAHALEAVRLSPYNFDYRRILASIKEARGRGGEAEDALRAALALAPNDCDTHWRLANLLLRERRLKEALDEFRVAATGNPANLHATLELVWRASGGTVEAVDFVTARTPEARFTLARFLLKQRRATDAVEVVGQIDKDALARLAALPAFLDELIRADQPVAARDLWIGIVEGERVADRVIYNGGFETERRKDFTQFDWVISQSEFARVSIESREAHTGSRSLRVAFAGRDTTRLDGEIKQTILLAEGARYRLRLFIKADGLETPSGPRIAVTDAATSSVIASSEPFRAGSYDWQPLTIEFDVPRARTRYAAAYVTVQRKPQFAYDEPTRGTVWLDDFTLDRL